MWYFVLYVIVAAWVFRDSRKRRLSPVPWTVATAILGPVVVPFYFAKRPLLLGETREGGTAWNVLKNFALFWTLTMFVVGVAGMFAASEAVNSTTDEVEQAGAAIGSAIGMGLIFVMWFLPLVGALVLGFFLKKSSIVERGPTGPLAAALLLAFVLGLGAVGCGKSNPQPVAATSARATVPVKQEATAKPAETVAPTPKASAKDPLGGDGDATLASREEAGQIMPSPLGQTLADVHRMLSSSGECKVERKGKKITITCNNRRGEMELDFTIMNIGGELGKVAVVETLAIETKMSPPHIMEGAEAHAALMQLAREDMQAQQVAKAEQAQKAEQTQKEQRIAKIKAEVARLQDGQIVLAKREQGGSVTRSAEGHRLADVYLALGLATPYVDPTVTRNGDKVRIGRKDAEAEITFEMVITDVQGAEKLAIVESCTIEDKTARPQLDAQTIAHRKQMGFVDKPTGPQVVPADKAYDVVTTLIADTATGSKR